VVMLGVAVTVVVWRWNPSYSLHLHLLQLHLQLLQLLLQLLQLLLQLLLMVQ